MGEEVNDSCSRLFYTKRNDKTKLRSDMDVKVEIYLSKWEIE